MNPEEHPTTPPVPVKKPLPDLPDPQKRMGNLLEERETTATGPMGSTPEPDAKHSLDPKPIPKPNAREKVTPALPAGLPKP